MAFQSPRTAKPGRVATKFLDVFGWFLGIGDFHFCRLPLHWSSGVSHDEVFRKKRQAASQGAESG